MKTSVCLLLCIFVCLFFVRAGTVNTKQILDIQLCELQGFTLLSCESAEGEFEGEEGDILKLYSGMIFKITSYGYQYSYGPQVIIFVGVFEYQGKEQVMYKLIIGTNIYDAIRIR